MATTDFVYGKARVGLGSEAINLLGGNVWAMLVGNGYTPNPLTDQFVSVIPPAAIVARSGPLTSCGITNNGVFFGTVPPFNSLLSATEIFAIILYVSTGVDATSPLLYYSSGGAGFPFTAQGFTYSVPYDQNNGGYFQP